jgi:hypothetical protein
MAKASDILRVPDPDARVREAKAWLKSKGVRDFEPVSLFCDQLTKVSLHRRLERHRPISDRPLGNRHRHREAG